MSWLLNQIKNNPNANYVYLGKQVFTFSEINDTVQIYAQELLRNGIQSKNKVLICLPNDLDLLEIILACFEIGAIAVPISPQLTIKECNEYIDVVNPSIIISNWNFESRCKGNQIPKILVEEIMNTSRGCGIVQNGYKWNKNDVAVIIGTSGTTNTPKAVQLTYSNFEVSCSNWNEFLLFDESDQFLCCLPLYHVGGLAVIIRALIYGFSINIINQFKPENIIHAMEQHAITIVSLVPTMLKRILDIHAGLGNLKKLRWILLGGGPSHVKLLDLCIYEKLNVVKVYGMSETCSGTIGLKLLEEPKNKLFAGRPFGKTKVWVENNEIYLSGPMVMKGYVGGVEVNGVHNSHDLGMVNNDGLVFLDIRRKDLIISGGENINPIEVEEALVNIDGIIDAAVIGLEDEDWGQKVVAYVEFKSSPLVNELIINKLKYTLSTYKIPKEFISVSSIPRNEIGKIKYDKLRIS